MGRKDQVSAQARGMLINLPAGPIDVVVGAEVARDEYNVATSEVIDVKRSSSAAYVEGRAPLLRSSNEGGGRWDLAAVTLAARRDHYSDFGSANTFQGGIELRPSRNLLIRGSAATSFKPPTLVQTNYADTVYDASIFGLVDPSRGGEVITSGAVVQGRNPALMPERGQARQCVQAVHGLAGKVTRVECAGRRAEEPLERERRWPWRRRGYRGGQACGQHPGNRLEHANLVSRARTSAHEHQGAGVGLDVGRDRQQCVVRDQGVERQGDDLPGVPAAAALTLAGCPKS